MSRLLPCFSPYLHSALTSFSLPPSLPPGMEKHVVSSNRYYDSGAKNIPYSDVARTCLIVHSLQDVTRTLDWFKAEKSLALVRARNRFGQGNCTGMLWQDALLNLVFVDKPDVVFEVQIVHHLMAGADLRNTEEFEEIRFCKEMLL